MANTSSSPAVPGVDPQRHAGFWALTLASVGVVFGDIGTSPLYAMREALHHARGAESEATVLGVVSLIFWALTLIVTLKYVVIMLRAHNNGEGGTLALMALAQRVSKGGAPFVFFLGICGAALFYGDGLITPAISVLSAVEGVADAPGVGDAFDPFILPVAAGILISLFMVQSRGTAAVGRFFGPITLVWFLTLAGLGLLYLVQEPSVLRGLSPHYGALLLVNNGWLGFAILGSVFLVVTGAEALYADMGHFGIRPIRTAWLGLVFPCLLINYLGQAALVISDPTAAENPFFRMIPQAIYWPVLALTTTATVIASQAVISGAFSVTQAAVQLGLLPRIDIQRTSESVAGQIFVPQVNTFLMLGVLALLVMFRNSSNLAAAYGIAITATMVIDVLLVFTIMRRHWRWSIYASLAVVAPLLALDLTFFGANVLKIPQGGWFPLVLGAILVLMMWTWTKGARLLAEKSHRDSIPLTDLVESLRHRPPHRAAGTAIFMTSDPQVAPVALMHNLKHNKVLHERNIVMTVVTAGTPRVPDEERVTVEPINADFTRVRVAFGFMETPNVPKALGLLRRKGTRLDIMATSFFLGRRSVVPSPKGSMPLWQDKLFVFMMKNAANPTDFFHIPPGRVVELGTQVVV
ncbi:potassium transporter Kup [Phenylobacterium terrae]|uniref:Probable potassium transport system protein Kup n=1 Tax=Phenylobacterium terrae TaxID=2665495 RepID=A0ABW4N724_9CAUL